MTDLDPDAPRCAHVHPTTGRPCANRISVLPTPDGPRCSWHDPARRDAQRSKQRASLEGRNGNARVTVDRDELPVGELLTIDDALTLARWLPVAIATGRIGGREAQAMVGALREFRMTSADASALARLGALEERIALARKKGLDV